MNKTAIIGTSLLLSILLYWFGDMIVGGFPGGAYINYGFPIPYKKTTFFKQEIIYDIPVIMLIDLLIIFVPIYFILNRLFVNKKGR